MRPGATRRIAGAALALVLLASRAAADEQRGLELVREAQAAMSAGDHAQAVELLRQARIEWPGAPLVANTLGDALRELGRYPEALTEYERGESGEFERHARFNRAVTRHLLAEQALAEAAVPADASALPEGAQPAMLQAVEQATPQLARAADEFFELLAQAPDEAARESIEALGRRTDALTAIAEELRRRQEQEPNEGQDQKQDEKPDQEQEQEQKDQQQQDQEQQEQQQGQQPQDQPERQAPQDGQPQDEPQPSEDDAQEPGEQQEQQQEQPQPTEGEPQGEPRELSPEEVQQLLDRLDQLEQQARQLQKAREAVRRRPVEQDW